LGQREGAGADVPLDPNIELAREIGRFAYNPLKHCMFAFPWGVEGLPLEKLKGPRQWQRGVMETIAEHLADPETRYTPCLIAVASGHGVGKSAEIAMLSKWALDSWVDARVVITANTEQQLITKTSPEVAKWHRMAITRDWFNYATMKISAKERPDSWRLDFVTWSANNTEAFQGLHNQGRLILVMMDEGSGIDDKVFEVTEGALTDENTVIIWVVFGNPTKNTGRFRECFGRYRNRWYTLQLDSRTVEGTNKAYLDDIVNTYGEDSDIARVRVRGLFPAASSMQFISSAAAEAARAREVEPLSTDPLIYGLDCARYGDDSSVLAKRVGRDAKSRPWKRWQGVDAMTLAGDVARQAAEEKPDAIFVDAGSIGAAVVDRLRQLEVPNVFEVWFGGQGRDVDLPGGVRYRVANKRTEMWVRMRNWLEGGAIPDEQIIQDDMTGTEYGFGRDEATLQLEKKEHMKARGLASPDNADALACTFAEAVMPRQLPGYLEKATRRTQDGTQEPDIYAELYR
jgi:hypothetical protein